MIKFICIYIYTHTYTNLAYYLNALEAFPLMLGTLSLFLFDTTEELLANAIIPQKTSRGTRQSKKEIYMHIIK